MESRNFVWIFKQNAAIRPMKFLNAPIGTERSFNDKILKMSEETFENTEVGEN